MGVDKLIEFDETMHRFLRFINTSTHIDCYMRKVAGDSWTLPQAAVLNSCTVSPDEEILADTEDLESCLNLFSMPDVRK